MVMCLRLDATLMRSEVFADGVFPAHAGGVRRQMAGPSASEDVAQLHFPAESARCSNTGDTEGESCLML